ncbi:hypothetical protein QZH56_35560 [Streptomyces olivoreticuli]|uniref:hypothetical protein n=1 Tax=Streptomyces olivoreticuli TaxID=68246 RepID=UPI002658AAA9|nr:hypothetical protein [Streptomyces olivoreticuli]WKK23944.1 hypothetical protein QZH56_35560 [Streptomyces olivoreticuli]
MDERATLAQLAGLIFEMRTAYTAYGEIRVVRELQRQGALAHRRQVEASAQHCWQHAAQTPHGGLGRPAALGEALRQHQSESDAPDLAVVVRGGDVP